MLVTERRGACVKSHLMLDGSYPADALRAERRPGPFHPNAPLPCALMRWFWLHLDHGVIHEHVHQLGLAGVAQREHLVVQGDETVGSQPAEDPRPARRWAPATATRNSWHEEALKFARKGKDLPHARGLASSRAARGNSQASGGAPPASNWAEGRSDHLGRQGPEWWRNWIRAVDLGAPPTTSTPGG